MEIENDFGFTFVDGEELNTAKTGLTSQLQELYDAIIPLLKNLRANPEKDTIVWPNRKEKIEQFKQKIDAIVGDSVIKRKL